VTDDELLAAFEGARLRPAEFDHPSHVRVAFLYLARLDPVEALARFRRGLKRLAHEFGVPGVYHDTVTRSLAFLIHERMASAPDSTTWRDFASANPDLLAWRDGVFFDYYDPDVLESVAARRAFVLPRPTRSPRGVR